MANKVCHKNVITEYEAKLSKEDSRVLSELKKLPFWMAGWRFNIQLGVTAVDPPPL